MYRPESEGESVLVNVRGHWTSGRWTGETGQFGEHFKIITDSPLVEPDSVRAHYEDIKEFTDENIEKYIKS